MTRYHLSSSQSDRIAYDEEITRWAQECYSASAPTSLRPEEAAHAHWALERAFQDVDDMEEAEARYLDAFAKGWRSAAHEENDA